MITDVCRSKKLVHPDTLHNEEKQFTEQAIILVDVVGNYVTKSKL